MNPEQYPQQPVSLSKANPLDVRQPGEQVVCEIKRHPIGIIGNYITTVLGLLGVLIVGIVVIRQAVSADAQNHVTALFMAGWIGLTAFSVLFLLIASKIYWNNRWIVTSDSITQIQQLGLLNRQTSQLSMANLEDVTAEQRGVLQSMFNFGKLRVETAGERSKFVFDYCPNPNNYARQILACREAFINNDPSIAKRANDELTPPTTPTPTNLPVTSV